MKTGFSIVHSVLMKQAANPNIYKAIKTNGFRERDTLSWYVRACVRAWKDTAGITGWSRFVQERSSEQQKAMD